MALIRAAEVPEVHGRGSCQKLSFIFLQDHFADFFHEKQNIIEAIKPFNVHIVKQESKSIAFTRHGYAEIVLQ